MCQPSAGIPNPGLDETVGASSPGGRSDNSPGRGPHGQVFVRGVEDERSAVLGQCPTKVFIRSGRCEIFSKELFNGIHYLRAMRGVVSSWRTTSVFPHPPQNGCGLHPVPETDPLPPPWRVLCRVAILSRVVAADVPWLARTLRSCRKPRRKLQREVCTEAR
jgi:hypothetical protein